MFDLGPLKALRCLSVSSVILDQDNIKCLATMLRTLGNPDILETIMLEAYHGVPVDAWKFLGEEIFNAFAFLSLQQVIVSVHGCKRGDHSYAQVITEGLSSVNAKGKLKVVRIGLHTGRAASQELARVSLPNVNRFDMDTLSSRPYIGSFGYFSEATGSDGSADEEGEEEEEEGEKTIKRAIRRGSSWRVEKRRGMTIYHMA